MSRKRRIEKTYDNVEKMYYKTGEVAELLRTTISNVRLWINYFGIKSWLRGKNRSIPVNSVGLLIEVNRLVRTELYTLAGAMRQLKFKYGEKYEKCYDSAKGAALLGDFRARNGEKPEQSSQQGDASVEITSQNILPGGSD